MSKHSIRIGSDSRFEHLAQLLERLDPPQPLRLRDERLGRERELGVLLRELLQPPLLAALRRAHLDPRAAQLREEALERAQVAEAARDEDLRRYRRRRAVVLDAEPLEHLERVVAGRVLEVERVAVDHPARRGAGRPAPRRARGPTARPITSIVPIEARSTAWRSASRSTACSRLR